MSVREAEISLGSGQANRIDDWKKKATSITVTLVTVSTAFLVLTLPMSFIQILSFVLWMTETELNSRTLFYLKQLSYPLWYVNSCINFYVYCLTGSKFRREAKQILSCLFQEDLDKPAEKTTVSSLSSKNETPSNSEGLFIAV